MSSVPGVTSDSDVKRKCSERTVLPNSPVVSSDSGMKRVHEKGTANDDEESLGTRVRILNLIAALHVMDAAEEDEICTGDEIHDECFVLIVH